MLKFEEIFTTAHTGKMEGMISISTPSNLNDFCKKMKANCELICSKCYTEKGFLKTVANSKKLKNNHELLTKPFDWQSIKHLEKIRGYDYFRFEAFGELNNEQQLINYLNLVRLFPNTFFSLWTKRTDLVAKVLTLENKPSNFNLIISSIKKNERCDLGLLEPVVDKVFTVFDKDFIKENETPINCGSKDCFNCKICYTKNNVKEVNEILK